MLARALDYDLGLLKRVEDLAVEQLVPELTSVTPIERIASATVRPCAVSTSTCRSLVTISSGLCCFLDIDPSSSWPKASHTSGRTTSQGADHGFHSGEAPTTEATLVKPFAPALLLLTASSAGPLA